MRTRASRWFGLTLFMIVLVSGSAWEERAPLVAGFLFLIATVLVGIGSLGRLWCALYIAGRRNRTLIREGPYSLCRNPLYFFSLLGALGVGFATETLTIPVVVLVGFAAYYPIVIGREESQLRRLHGDQYESYLATVPRFFPRVGKLAEPESCVVDPVMFKKHIASAVWFIWLIGIMEIVEALHKLGIIPVLFRIY